MNSPSVIRIVHVIAALATAAGLVVSSTQVSFLARVFSRHLNELLGEAPLPALTTVVFSLADRAPLFGAIAACSVLAAAVVLVGRAPSPDAASTRLVVLLSFGWVTSLLLLGTATVAVIMPFLSITLRFTQ